eukprot:9475895-Pyramimonas_sp.AAC.1
MATTLLARVKKCADGVGIYFSRLTFPFAIGAVADSSGATSGGSNAQEAALPLLGLDQKIPVAPASSMHCQQVRDSRDQLSKFARIIASLSHEAKGESGSASPAETRGGAVGK